MPRDAWSWAMLRRASASRPGRGESARYAASAAMLVWCEADRETEQARMQVGNS